MTTEDPLEVETFEFRTRLAPGLAAAYEQFHRAIPAELDSVMRASGVQGWQIFVRGDVLTHRVTANRARLKAELDPNPVNAAWQRQIAPYLVSGLEPDAPPQPGALIWDLSWPVR
jgi:L-rhamnose mutarotase